MRDSNFWNFGWKHSYCWKFSSSSRCHIGPFYWHSVYDSSSSTHWLLFVCSQLPWMKPFCSLKLPLQGLWIASLPKQMRSKGPGCNSWKGTALHCEDWQVTTTPEQRVGHRCGEIPLLMLVFPSHHNLSKCNLPLKGLAAEM